LVVFVVQAQSIAVCQNRPFAGKVQGGWVLQQCGVSGLCEPCAHQEIPIAVQEVDRQARCRQPDRLCASGFKGSRVIQNVVTHPDFKQVAKNKQGICGGVLHELHP
jgi:hypothetical protein